MKILMVGPYAPARDGIASYTVQEVRRLVEEGHQVEVLSPGPSAAHHHLDLRSWRGPLALAKRMRAYDRVIIQFHPDVFYAEAMTPARRDANTLGLAVAFALGNVEVRVHEVNYGWGEEQSRSARLFRSLWRLPKRITVHTTEERDRLCASMRLPASRVELLDHGAHFVARTNVSRGEARARLGLTPTEHVFVSIGFIQPHKGFDRAVRAFAASGLASVGASLHVVGSVRVEEDAYLTYLDELRAQISETPGAHLHDGYVSDELFDVWLVAADTLVLPYRFIWSSGVMERAELYGRAVIATRVGGLDGQAGPNVTLVDGEDELVGAMRTAAGLPAAEPVVRDASEPWPVTPGARPERAALQDEIQRRAAVAAARHHGRVRAERSRVPSGGPPTSLRDIRYLEPPSPASSRLSAEAVKRVVRKVTAWEVDPVIHQLNTVHDTVARLLEPEEDTTDGNA